MQSTIEDDILTDEHLVHIQRQMYKKYNTKIDIYHSEQNRVIGVFPHGEMPTPFHALEVIRY